jgi:inosine-uridine nucleoside N-ribohydrolase
VRLWIDTDVGTNPDDAFALLLATAHPDVELVGVSVVDGDLRMRAAVARRLVRVPVVDDAAVLDEVLSSTAPDVLLAIGPLTNVARLLDRGVEIRRLCVMGGALGAVHHRGTVRHVEHNFGRDPGAVRTVLDRAPALLVCPLDVTARMRLPRARLDELRPDVPLLVGWCEQWAAEQQTAGVGADEAIVLHDPLALLAATRDDAVTVARQSVAVDDDGRLQQRGAGRECDVVVDVDVERALTRVVHLVTRAEPPDH